MTPPPRLGDRRDHAERFAGDPLGVGEGRREADLLAARIGEASIGISVATRAGRRLNTITLSER